VILWLDRWRRPTGKTGPQRRAFLCLEALEDRCVMSAVGYGQVNLASDLPGLADVTVPSLVNPWGISFSPTGPFWFADNGSGVSTILDGRGDVVPLTVMVPPASESGSNPTGTVFNGGPGFIISANGVSRPSRFLFATENGTISGWTTAVDPNAAVVAVDNSALGADYKGLALATNAAGQSFLYAADFGRSEIDVFNQDFTPVERAGAFQDPNLPAGFAPFNIQNVDGRLFVAYAEQNVNQKGEELPGAGLGFIDVYNTDGVLLSRFASQGALNAPWGITLAPASFGRFGGALLVGNNGDGLINAYDPATGAFLGQLENRNGAPIAIPDLWALTFGNGHEGGNAQTLFFAAGIDYEAHGLFGAIQPPQLRGTDTAGIGVYDPHAPGEPGDYPLPPAEGPALQASSTPTHPVSVLLPLTQSSLLLAPTLSTVSQAGATSSAPVSPLLFAGLDTPNVSGVRFVAFNSAATSSSPDSTLALNSFLDLNVAPNARAELPLVPPRIAYRDAVNPSAYFVNDTPLFADLQSIRAETGSYGAEGQPASPTPDPPQTGQTRQAGIASNANGTRNSWTKVLSLLCVIGVRVGWGYLMEPDRRRSNISQTSLGLGGDKGSN
jgi:uncharacterized protein (TIGR03118 family)